MGRDSTISSAIRSLLVILAALAFLLHPFHGGDDCDVASGGGESVSRAFFPIDGDVAWIVQVSDLHLSAYHPERGEALRTQLGPALKVIRPSLVLITGDLVDAKNKGRTSSRQDETEWVQYRSTIDAVIKASGIDENRFIDTRGNHDKYGVPFVGSKLDYFSNYSISSQTNRLSTIQSISLVGNEWRYIVLGVDDTMEIGLRGPSHLFGHITDERMEAIASELQYWESYPDLMIGKIVFGHFPLSFLTSSVRGKHYEALFAEKSISAYLCGHLHAKFSRKLWRKHVVDFTPDFGHSKESKQFWEWELGDWKESRLIRILAIDGGKVSFLDIELPNRLRQDGYFDIAILITYPLDSRNMILVETESQMLRDDISVLVFSTEPIVSVTAKIFDSSQGFLLLEEISLKPSNNSATYGILFTSKWNVESYRSVSSSRYWVQVFVLDIYGKETASQMRPFSVGGKPVNMRVTWLEYLIFHIQWQNLYLNLLWSNITFLFVLLLLPKIIDHLIEKDVLYQSCAVSASISLPVQQKQILYWVLWFLMEGSRNKILWYAMSFYLICLLKLPWFWGHATSENGELSKMFMFGWTVDSYNCSTKKSMLGFPDVMTVTLPFMYLVVSPMFLLIYGLFAERSAFYMHKNEQLRCKKESQSRKEEPEGNTQPAACVISDSTKTLEAPSCTISRNCRRKVILVACLFVFCIYLKLLYSLMRAYGAVPIALSPVFCWMPPLLMASALYATQQNTRKCHLV